MILFEVVEMGLATCNHAEKSASGVVIFAVLAQMSGQFGDSFGQKGYLNF